MARSDGGGSGAPVQARLLARQLSVALRLGGWHPLAACGRPAGDRTTFFYNPCRKVWVFSIRDVVGGQDRVRRYQESAEFIPSAQWKEAQPVLWTMADPADPRRPEFNVPVELYNLDCVAYESIMLGLFTMFRGERTDREKPNDICVGYSRDGFHWARSDRQRFIAVSERVGDWNWANVQSAGGCCLVVGDRLSFYEGSRGGVGVSSGGGGCSTGLTTPPRRLRLDGGQRRRTRANRSWPYLGERSSRARSCSTGASCS
jgi:hypothetical protein